MKKFTIAFLTVVLMIISANIYALQKQSAASPGEVLDSDTDATTPVLMKGVFAVEMTSTGVGTINIQRSEDGTTYHTVKAFTNTAAEERRKYLYESFGDEDSSKGAWYKAVMSGNPSAGSFRVRLVQ